MQFGEQWAELNPEWEVWEWSLETVWEIMWRCADVLADIEARGAAETPTGFSVEAAVQMADVLGYEIVWKHGGVYVNVDIEPLRSMDYFLERHSIGNLPYAGREDTTTDRVVNAVIGASQAEHPFWNLILGVLPARYFGNPEADMVSTTGPALLTDCLRGWPREAFKVVERRVWNPVHWSEVPEGGDASAYVQAVRDDMDVCGVHHWGHRRSGRTNYVTQ